MIQDCVIILQMSPFFFLLVFKDTNIESCFMFGWGEGVEAQNEKRGGIGGRGWKYKMKKRGNWGEGLKLAFKCQNSCGWVIHDSPPLYDTLSKQTTLLLKTPSHVRGVSTQYSTRYVVLNLKDKWLLNRVCHAQRVKAALS